jgi:hypothetical protein
MTRDSDPGTVERELAMMIRMLASALKQCSPQAARPDDLPSRAVDLLKKHGLVGSPLRAEDSSPVGDSTHGAVDSEPPALDSFDDAGSDCPQRSIDALVSVIAQCRDALPTPEPGGRLEDDWSSAMSDPYSVPAYVQASVERLQRSADFYRRRVDLLQQWQSRMRDPERTIVCDIIANAQMLPDPEGRRYGPAPLPDVALPPRPKTCYRRAADGEPLFDIMHLHQYAWRHADACAAAQYPATQQAGTERADERAGAADANPSHHSASERP